MTTTRKAVRRVDATTGQGISTEAKLVDMVQHLTAAAPIMPRRPLIKKKQKGKGDIAAGCGNATPPAPPPDDSKPPPDPPKPLTDMSDFALVQDYHFGMPGAADALARRLLFYADAFLASRVKDRHLREDISQSAVITGLVKIRQFNPEHPRASLRNWFSVITFHTIVGFSRQAGREPAAQSCSLDGGVLPIPVAGRDPDPADAVADAEEAEIDANRHRRLLAVVGSVLAEEKPAARAALLGVHIDGRSYADAQRMLNASCVGSAAAMLDRGKARVAGKVIVRHPGLINIAAVNDHLPDCRRRLVDRVIKKERAAILKFQNGLPTR